MKKATGWALVSVVAFAIGVVVLLLTEPPRESTRAPDAPTIAADPAATGAHGTPGSRTSSRPASGPRRANDADDPSAAESRGPPDRDHDLHGVVLEGADQPVSGAGVAIMRNEGCDLSVLDLEYHSAEVRIAGTRTDSERRFRVRVPQGRGYGLVVSAAGHPTTTVRNRFAGEFVRVVLGQAAGLKGVVTRAADHAPVAGARIKAWKPGDPRLVFEGATDESGKYGFTGLESGQIVVELAPLVERSPEWTDLKLRPGETLVHDFVLEAGTTVSGIVKDAATGEPIAGAEVGEGWTFFRSVRTGGDGRYVLRGACDSEIHVRAKGYGRRQHELPRPLPADVEVSFSLTSARSVRGRVVDPEGSAVGGAYVAAPASAMVNGLQAIDWPATRSGPDGQFRIEDLRRDIRHAVWIRKEGFGSATFELPPAEMTEDVIELGDLVIAKSGSVSGVVVDTKDRPVPDFAIVVTGENDDRHRFQEKGDRSRAIEGHYLGLSGRTDDLGRFRLTDLAPGEYRVSASRSSRDGARPVAFTIRAGEVVSGIRLVVPIRFSIMGRVMRADGGAVPPCVVDADLESTPDGPRNGRSGAMTAGDGEFEIKDLEGGTYTLTARIIREDGVSVHGLATTSVKGVRTGSDNVRIVMGVAKAISGVVLTSAGTPQKDGLVTACDLASGIQLANTRTGEDGAFALEVPDGATVRLKAQTPVFVGGRLRYWDDPSTEVASVLAGTTGLTLTLPKRD